MKHNRPDQTPTRHTAGRLTVIVVGLLSIAGGYLYTPPSSCTPAEPMAAWCVSGTALIVLGVAIILSGVFKNAGRETDDV